MSLLTELQHAGLEVIPHPGWETNTNQGRDRLETVGVINHWDAITGWPGVNRYMEDNRFGGILYHTVVERDGLVHLLSQRYVWHAGRGDTAVLNALRNAAIPPHPADKYASDGTPLTDTSSGNPRTVSAAINYHPNDGPVPDAQYEALVKVNRVYCNVYGLSTNQIIDHDHWTTRKWDIRTLDLNTFRRHVRELEMIDRHAKADDGQPILAPSFEAAVKAGVMSEATQPGGVAFNDEIATFFKRAGLLDGGRTWTRKQIAAIAAASAAGGATVGEVIQEIIARLGG